MDNSVGVNDVCYEEDTFIKKMFIYKNGRI